MNRLVRLGTVVRAIGLDGHLGVAGTEGGVARVGRVRLRPPGAEAGEARVVLEARKQGRLWAVRIDGVADRGAAEALVGSEVLAERGALGDPGEGRHYWSDLEGLAVESADGTPLGRVTGLYVTGGVDVLAIEGAAGERLVPLAPWVTVDREAGRVRVDAPEGLLEIEATKRDRGRRTRTRTTWRGSRSRS
ncbi:MAG TPA: ribosome maturation factor RimM [Anaeromyxobacteraceae bacterium]|nr:ribosome maturation factor RimM [Anaeromyxobacteraceae bacterium]